MNKKERKQFEKQLQIDVLKFLCNKQVNLQDYKAINKALEEFDNTYYTEIKYQLKCTKDLIINIKYKEEK